MPDRMRKRHLGSVDLILEVEGGENIADGCVWAEIVLFQYPKESEGCKELGEGADWEASLHQHDLESSYLGRYGLVSMS